MLLTYSVFKDSLIVKPKVRFRLRFRGVNSYRKQKFLFLFSMIDNLMQKGDIYNIIFDILNRHKFEAYGGRIKWK